MTKLADTKGDDWNDMAKAYKKLTVDTSRGPIGVILEKANARIPFSDATGVLDNGCGPGPIMTRILTDYKVPNSTSLTCSDFSEGMIQQVRNTKQESVEADSSSPWTRVETMVQDAMNLENIADASQSHVTAGWVYFMTPSPQKCLSESKRVLKDGGVLACSSWQGSQWMDLMNLVPTIRPDITMPAVPDEWSNVDKIKVELEKAGFREVESVQVTTHMSLDKRAPFIDFICEKMPHMVGLMKDFSKDDVYRLKAEMDKELQKMCPDEPATLEGVALVAVGTK